MKQINEYWITLRDVRPDGSKGNFPPTPHNKIAASSIERAVDQAAYRYERSITDIRAQLIRPSFEISAH